MEKSKLLQVIAAIMIASMTISILSFSTTTVKATLPSATVLPSSARANTKILFTVTVTNNYTSDNIDNIRVYFTSGFSTPVAYSDNLVQAAGNIENAVPYIKQAGENLKLAEDNKKSSGPNIGRAAENLDITRINNWWNLENATASGYSSDENANIAMDNIATHLRLVADAIDNDYENLGDVPGALGYIKSHLDNAAWALIFASGVLDSTPNDGNDNIDNINDTAGEYFYRAGENLRFVVNLYIDNADLENMGWAIENAGLCLISAASSLTQVNIKTYINNAGTNLQTAGLKLRDAGNFVDNAGYALCLAVNPLFWGSENLSAVTNLTNAGDNLENVARYLENAGNALRDYITGINDQVIMQINSVPRAGENLKRASYFLENVAFWLGVDLGKDNENAAAVDLKQAGENLDNIGLLNLTTAGNELVSMGTNLLAGATKMRTTASSLTPTTWTMSSGAENVEFSSIGDNIIAPNGGSQTFKFLWTTPNITTATDYPLSVFSSKEETVGILPPYPNWENLGGFTVRIDGAVPTVTINVTQAGVATTNLVGNKLDSAQATITIVASEVLSSIDNVYIMDEFRQDNLLPPIPGSSFTSDDGGITWRYQYITVVENWDDNFTWVRLSKATDLAGNENTDTANDNIGMENSFTVDTRAPVFADNGLTSIRSTMVENRVQPGTGTVYRWLDNDATKDLYIVVGDNLGTTGKDTRVTSVTVNGSPTTKNNVTDNLWTTSMTLPEGYTAAIVVTATDSTGNSKSENLENIFVDTQFPQISFETITRKLSTINWTENGILINDNKPTIKIIVTDPGYPDTGWGVARDNLRVCFDNDDNIGWLGNWWGNNPYSFENLENKYPWNLESSMILGIFENKIDNLGRGLVSGTYWINVMATDNLWHGIENKKIASRSFTIDLSKPATTDIVFDVTAYTTTTPVDPQVQKITTLSLSGTIPTGEVGGVINLYVGGVLTTSITTTTATWSTSITLTTGSTQKIEVTLTDLSGNESDKKLYGYFMADGTASTVTISSPATGTSTDKTSISITGAVTKDTWEAYTDLIVKIQVGGAASGDVTLDASGNFTSSATLGEGTNVITITARDAAGNVGSASITIERTVTPLTTYAIILVVVALILAAIAIFRKEMK